MVILILWWLVLFCLLPFGVRSQLEAGEVVAGSEPGAPQQTHLVKKAVWAFLIAIVIWAAMFWVVNYWLLVPGA